MFWRKRGKARVVEEVFRKAARAVFPGGQRQIDAEAAELFARLEQRVSLDEARQILIHAKGRVFIGLQAPSRSEDTAKHCVESIRVRAGGALDEAMARDVYEFVVQRMIEGAQAKGHVVGGAGSLSGTQARQADHVVEVGASTARAGIDFEYRWLERHFGTRDKDWSIMERTHGWADDGNAYEIFTVSTREGDRKVISFDISSFYEG
ncbi:MAG: hypothetical protein OXH52_00675 [Gammaproteobacteria bacterium]|nr:hypothetical protein [Gammaproteobacteria bacterium]